MRHLLAALLLAALPVSVMGEEDAACAAAWAPIEQAVFGGAGAANVTAGENGWCDVDLTRWSGADVRFGSTAFRTDRFAQAAQGHRSLEVVLEGVETPFGTFDGRIAASVNPQTGIAQVHTAQFAGGDGRGIRANARIGLATFWQVAQDQPIEPLVDAQFITIDFIVTPAALAQTRIDFAEVTRAAVDDALRDVGETQISAKTRREFLRFVGAAPNAQGTLRVAIQLSDDVSPFDLVGPFAMLGTTPSEADIARAFDASTRGVRLDVTWKPGRM